MMKKPAEKKIIPNYKSSLPPSLFSPVRNIRNALSPGKTRQNISYFFSSDPNLIHNTKMEDVGIQIKNYCNSPQKYLFGIFDGHNGPECAKFASKTFPGIFEALITDKQNNEIEPSLTSAFLKLDGKCVKYENKGTTATIVYIDNKDLYCANVGDSSCMIVNKYQALKISFDDKCSDINEKERIEKEGGYVLDGRIDGVLAVSRAIGDFKFKNKGLSRDPHICKKNIEDGIKFCILASDGVWDVVDEELIYKWSKENRTAKEFANNIVKFSKELGSGDNISCIVIKFE